MVQTSSRSIPAQLEPVAKRNTTRHQAHPHPQPQVHNLVQSYRQQCHVAAALFVPLASFGLPPTSSGCGLRVPNELARAF